MKRYLVTQVFLLLLAGCASPLPPAGPVAANVQAPQMQIGDYWEYSVSDGYTRRPRGTYRYEVRRFDADNAIVEVTQDGRPVETQIYAAGWSGRDHTLTNLQRFRYDPPYPAYAFPLAPGKSWVTVVNATDPATGKVYRVHVRAKVIGWERIRVPAGEFDTLKIQRYVFAGNPQWSRSQEEIAQTDWYAPAVRRAVRSQGNSSHIDSSRSGEEGPLVINGDWLIAELVGYSGR